MNCSDLKIQRRARNDRQHAHPDRQTGAATRIPRIYLFVVLVLPKQFGPNNAY